MPLADPKAKVSLCQGRKLIFSIAFGFDKQESSFSKKLKDKRESYKLQQLQNHFMLATKQDGFHRSNSQVL